MNVQRIIFTAGALALTVAVAAAYVLYAPHGTQKEPLVVPAPPLPSHEAVSEYLRANITTLSPEPPVLGGTFYVTDISFSASHTGVVAYEDGHIALVADFVYEGTSDGGVVIPAFRVRPQPPAVKQPVSSDTKPLCSDMCGNGTCEEVVCTGSACPCAETAETCSADCGTDAMPY